jgi:hypothetical protein
MLSNRVISTGLASDAYKFQPTELCAGSLRYIATVADFPRRRFIQRQFNCVPTWISQCRLRRAALDTLGGLFEVKMVD